MMVPARVSRGLPPVAASRAELGSASSHLTVLTKGSYFWQQYSRLESFLLEEAKVREQDDRHRRAVRCI
jgi:protein involved in temperature-dependent protein secretion